MSAAKFQPTGQPVADFIEAIDSVNKQKDAYQLFEIFEEISGYPGQMWYPGIIGFGKYQYQTASGIKGDSSLVAFAPRKARISIYLAEDFPERQALLEKLGKHQEGKMCIYVNKLADIDLDVLSEMVKASLAHTLKINGLDK